MRQLSGLGNEVCCCSQDVLIDYKAVMSPENEPTINDLLARVRGVTHCGPVNEFALRDHKIVGLMLLQMNSRVSRLAIRRATNAAARTAMLVGLLTLFAPQPSSARPQMNVPSDWAGADRYRACMSEGSSSLNAMGRCGDEYIDTAMAEMARMLEKRRATQSLETVADLNAEQALWQAFLVGSCRYYTDRTFVGAEGVMVHFPLCRVGIVHARTKQLTDLFNRTGDDRG